MLGQPKQQNALARRGSEILRFADGKRANPKDFQHERVALFVHGFTADASAMENLMSQFDGAGFRSLAFNYPCFDGIDTAAKGLAGVLHELDDISDGALSTNRFVLVCHSMGGLVGRCLVSLEGGSRYVKKLITLGTPHNGTLKDIKIVEYLLAASEAVSGLINGGFSRRSLSALQMIGRDGNQLLDKLGDADPPSHPVEFHSISGGLAYLEFSEGGYLSRAANEWIQWQMAGLSNDGLIAEDSSDLARSKHAKSAPGAQHHSSYTEYRRVNHSNLTTSYRVALLAIRLAK